MKNIEILKNDNIIIESDEHGKTEVKVFPENFKFKVYHSVHNDIFRAKEVYEYKVQTNPIAIHIRKIEDWNNSSGDKIIDGVVIESELLVDDGKYRTNTVQEEISSLKKSTEWAEVNIFDECATNLYILSLHKEIVPTEEYRKFIRQSLERIKVGIIKIQKHINNDTEGLAILFKEGYGTHIWYKENVRVMAEKENYFNLSKDEQKHTKFHKQSEHAELFSDSLFDETSKRYSGITGSEFFESKQLISYLENLLEDASQNSVQQVQETKGPSRYFTLKWLGVIILSIIGATQNIWIGVGIFIICLITMKSE